MRWLRRLRWVLLVPGVLGVAITVWQGGWPLAALFAGLFTLPWLFVQVESAVTRWHEQRELRSLRGGIKRVRGKSVIPHS